MKIKNDREQGEPGALTCRWCGSAKLGVAAVLGDLARPARADVGALACSKCDRPSGVRT